MQNVVHHFVTNFARKSVEVDEDDDSVSYCRPSSSSSSPTSAAAAVKATALQSALSSAFFASLRASPLLESHLFQYLFLPRSVKVDCHEGGGRLLSAAAAAPVLLSGQ